MYKVVDLHVLKIWKSQYLNVSKIWKCLKPQTFKQQNQHTFVLSFTCIMCLQNMCSSFYPVKLSQNKTATDQILQIYS